MKISILFIFISITILSCAKDKRPLKGETEFQKAQNAKFKDATTSPLKDKDRKNFEGLDFFKFDSTYIVKALLNRTPNSEWFNMKTTTSRVSKERVYGVLTFKLNGNERQLNIYQGEDLLTEDDYEDYLFLPFLDETNGLESYINVRIPEGDTMIIDFNKSYNPFCAYNDKYSCPIVPRENYLKTRIEAGVKGFAKH